MPRVRIVPIAQLVLDEKNANKGTKRGRELLGESLEKYGAARSVVDRNNRVIAGNKTVETARAAGMKSISVIETDGSSLVAVQRGDTENNRKRFFMALHQRVCQHRLHFHVLADPGMVHVEYQIIALVQRESKLRIHGTVDSVIVVSGPPLLQQAALSSAKQSQFQCLDCTAELTPCHLFYAFRLDIPPDACTGPDPCNIKSVSIERSPEVALSENRITLTNHPSQVCICDYVRKVRSVKCLYLWKCGIG